MRSMPSERQQTTHGDTWSLTLLGTAILLLGLQALAVRLPVAALLALIGLLVGCLVSSVTLSRSTSVIGKARERRTSRC